MILEPFNATFMTLNDTPYFKPSHSSQPTHTQSTEGALTAMGD